MPDLRIAIVAFLKEHYPQFHKHPQVKMLSEEDYYKEYERVQGEPLIYEGKLVQTDGFYDVEGNALVFRGIPDSRTIVHESTHWMQAQKYGVEWLYNPTNFKEMEREAEEMEDTYSSVFQPSVIRQPAVIAQYPGSEGPEDLSKETGVPGAPVPRPRGAADIWKEVQKEAAAKDIKADHPLKLSIEDYNRDWKPKGWKIIFIGPTATWREDWGSWEAIREIVQNALDEAERYDSGYDKLGAYIKDSGRGIAISNFLLGPSKLKPPHARGKYGEGMKIGALAMVRQGYPVLVQTGNRELYIIFFEQEADGKVETLAALWHEIPTVVGTTWHIIGYTGSLFESNFAVNIPKKNIISSSPSKLGEPIKRYNQLIATPQGEKSAIFSRDIFLQYINSPFSYNLWSFELAPDRHAPMNESEMWEDVGRVWSCVNKKEYIKIFLQMTSDPPQMETDETHLARLTWLGTSFEGKGYDNYMIANKTIWQSAWNEVHGDNSVLKTNDKYIPTVKHLAYEPVAVDYGARTGLSYVIKTDRQLIDESQDKLREVQVIPKENLTPRQLASLELARAINDRLYLSEPTGGIEAAIIPPASDRVRTAGLYSRTTAIIFIAASQLNDGSSTVDTLVHELAHHVSGAEDGIAGHYEAISSMAGEVVRLVASGRLDDVIKAPDFKWR